ncbi:MAG: TetR/AcrR family transcriptional regulator [Alphaproteobacteria bacterium]|nr:TetR/AcrR family transcriptional regulator [Alphaproteobacteria bacterium]
MTRKPRLSRTEWIKAAFRALTSGGPQAIRVESIARELQVSKGSFYWHFKDLMALKKAMIDHWLEQGTAQIIAGLQDKATPPRARLVQLMKTATAGQSGPYGGPRVEAAIRDWARYEGFVQAGVAETDRQRLEFVAGLICSAGADKATAQRRAEILYATLVGLEQLSGRLETNAENLLLTTLDHLLSDLPDLP